VRIVSKFSKLQLIVTLLTSVPCDNELFESIGDGVIVFAFGGHFPLNEIVHRPNKRIDISLSFVPKPPHFGGVLLLNVIAKLAKLTTQQAIFEHVFTRVRARVSHQTYQRGCLISLRFIEK
jgi:hypothetical protein